MSGTSPSRPSGVCADDAADCGFRARGEADRHHVAGELHAHVGRNEARIDAIDAHAIAELARLHRPDPGQPVDGRLGRGIAGDARKRDGRRDGSDVDDRAALAGRPVRLHGAERMLHAERRADDIDVPHAAQILGFDIDDQRGDLDAGVVDEDVEAAQFGDRRRHRGLPARVVGDVEGHEGGLGAAGRDRLRGLPANVRQHVADHHRRASPGKRRRHPGAEAARAAGHQGLPAGEVECAH